MNRVALLARNARLSFVFALVAMGAFGCGDDATSPEDTPVGVWTLVSVDGEPLPFVLETAVSKLEVLASRITINSDDTCSVSATVRVTIDGNMSTTTESADCTWTRSGNVIMFTGEDGSPDAAAWSGDTLTTTSDTGVVGLWER